MGKTGRSGIAMMARSVVAVAVVSAVLGLAGAAMAQNLTPLPPGGIPTAPGSSTAPAQFSDAERTEIGNIVRSYLLENPDVIVEVLQILQSRQQQAERQQQHPQSLAATEDIVDPELDPFIGNPDAGVTVVEFFDYQCPFCKRIDPSVVALVEGDSDVRVVYKEFPVFGPESTFAARASLAAHRQGKYKEFHTELLKNGGRLSERVVMRLADRLGLDVDQLRSDMETPEIERTIQNNFQIARQLGIRGTPSFVIGGEVIAGAIDLRTMRRLVRAVRQR